MRYSLKYFCAFAEGRGAELEWSEKATLGIVLASKGYPGDYEKGHVIEGLDKVDAKVYHMGTALKDGKFVTNGGRVLFVVGEGDTLKEAQASALAAVEKIECDNLFHRTDIGYQAIK